MISYKKLLEQNEIYDLDYISEYGLFFREYRPLNEHVTVGYKGLINYDEKGTHLLYVRQQCLDYETYLDDTPLFNAQFSNLLIAENYDDNNFTVTIASNEDRDVIDLYNSYILNPKLFLERQDLLMKLESIDERMDRLNSKKERILTKLNKIDSNIKK